MKDESPLERALTDYDAGQTLQRAAQAAAAAEASQVAPIDEELARLLSDFTRRMPSSAAQPLIHLERIAYQVRVDRGGRWSRNKRFDTRYRFEEHEITRGWVLQGLGRELHIGSTKTDDPITATYVLAVSTAAEPFLAVIREGLVVASGHWRKGLPEYHHRDIVVGRPAGNNFRSTVARALQLQGPVTDWYLWEGPNSASQVRDVRAPANVVEQLTAAMARTLRSVEAIG